jgi:nitrite reductase/ring-hydroxylating ferredoxin subunit
MPEVFVAKSAQLKDGDRRIVRTPRGEIGVFHHAGGYYAYANTCAHSGGPACEGVMMPQVVDIIAEDRTYHGQTFSEDDMHFVCPWHGYEYDIKTGVCVGDHRLKLKSYEVVQRGDDIFVIA